MSRSLSGITTFYLGIKNIFQLHKVLLVEVYFLPRIAVMYVVHLKYYRKRNDSSL